MLRCQYPRHSELHDRRLSTAVLPPGIIAPAGGCDARPMPRPPGPRRATGETDPRSREGGSAMGLRRSFWLPFFGVPRGRARVGGRPAHAEPGAAALRDDGRAAGPAARRRRCWTWAAGRRGCWPSRPRTSATSPAWTPRRFRWAWLGKRLAERIAAGHGRDRPGRCHGAALGGRPLQRRQLPELPEVRPRSPEGAAGDAPGPASRRAGRAHVRQRTSRTRAGRARSTPSASGSGARTTARRMMEEAGFTDVSVGRTPTRSALQLVRGAKRTATGRSRRPSRHRRLVEEAVAMSTSTSPSRSDPPPPLACHPLLRGRPPRLPSTHGRAARALASEARPLGDHVPHDDRAPHGQGAERDARLLRGRPEPGRARRERLGRCRACLVAQPPGPSRRQGRAQGRASSGQGTRGGGRGAGTPVGPLARPRRPVRGDPHGRHRQRTPPGCRASRRSWCWSRDGRPRRGRGVLGDVAHGDEPVAVEATTCGTSAGHAINSCRRSDRPS